MSFHVKSRTNQLFNSLKNFDSDPTAGGVGRRAVNEINFGKI